MQEAARYLKLTARDLLALGVVEQVIAEGSPKDFSSVYNTVKAAAHKPTTNKDFHSNIIKNRVLCKRKHDFLVS